MTNDDPQDRALPDALGPAGDTAGGPVGDTAGDTAGGPVGDTAGDFRNGVVEKSESYFKGAFEHAPIGIAIVATDGRWLEVNHSIGRFLGTTEHELLQHTLYDRLHPGDRVPAAALVRRALTTDQSSHQARHRFLHKSGREVWGLLSVTTVRNDDGTPRYFIVQIQDLTAAVHAERGLAESEARYRNLVSSLHEGVMLLAASGRIMACNPSAERILGLSEEQLKRSRGIDAALRGVREDGTPLPAEENPICQAFRSGRPRSGNIMGVDRPDGKRIWIHLNARPLYQQGNLTPHAVVASFSDVSAIKHQEEALARLAYDDLLTGLPNRRSFFRTLAERDGEGSSDAVMVLDLDGFRKVNEKFGYAAGDALLSEVGQRLAAIAEPSDVARLGGNEFAILQRHVDGPAAIVRLAKRILAHFETPVPVGESEVKVDVSLGIVVDGEANLAAEELTRRADLALQRARRTGVPYQVYNVDFDQEIRHALDLSHDLRKALPRHELSIFYQPIIDLEQQRITSMEALLRWRHPQRSMVSPAEFIPVAEESGLILSIGEWLIEQTLLQLQAWQVLRPDLQLSLNLSPKQLEQPGFLELITTAIRRSGVRPDSLLLELTETYVMQRVEEGGKKLRDLADLGVGIAIDDFGTGYSALSFLQHLPITHVKVDRSFIRRVPNGGRADMLVHAIFALAQTLDLTVIAEGIETELQARFLRNLGCRFGQGFLFHHPLPVDAINRLLDGSANDRSG